MQSGEVEIYKTSETGEKLTLAIVTEGTSLGEFAMIVNQPRSATAQALTAVTAVEVSEEAYKQLLADLPEWAVSVMTSLVERIRNTNVIVQRAPSVTPAVRLEIETVEYETDLTRIKHLDEIERDPLDDEETPDLA